MSTKILKRKIYNKDLYRFLRIRRIRQGSPLEGEERYQDREYADQQIRLAKRRGELHKIYEIALQHPLRPIQVRSSSIRFLLEKEGFTFIPGSFSLMLPPEGVSRRKAKARRDEIVVQAKKDWERQERLIEENDRLREEVENLRYELLREDLDDYYREERTHHENTTFTFEDLLR